MPREVAWRHDEALERTTTVRQSADAEWGGGGVHLRRTGCGVQSGIRSFRIRLAFRGRTERTVGGRLECRHDTDGDGDADDAVFTLTFPLTDA